MTEFKKNANNSLFDKEEDRFIGESLKKEIQYEHFRFIADKGQGVL